jgi:hypothetical protein
MPATTKNVPAIIIEVAGSRRTTMAMVALMSGLIDCNEPLREAPIFSTPV